MSITNQTIELVGFGHPDRFADYIGELILEKNYEQDKEAKVAIEVLATRNSISLGGELTSKANINYEELVYEAIETVYGERWWPKYKESVKVFNHIVEQSTELTTIQNEKNEIVAGDQGVIYGYYNPKRFATINYLYEIMKVITDEFDVAPDWKLLYDESVDGVKSLSMSVCGDVDHESIKHRILEVIKEKDNNFCTEVIVNPKGKWLIPGPLADTGVVGRKLMIDTFGAGIPHGGGAFCGKDPSKVDKTGILWGSIIAKEYYNNITEQEWNRPVKEIIVEMSFKIGDSKPKVNISIVKDFQNDDRSKIERVNSSVNITLAEFIDKNNIKDIKWSEHVLKGSSVLSILNEL